MIGINVIYGNNVLLNLRCLRELYSGSKAQETNVDIDIATNRNMIQTF